jgi:hypothetical protein
MQNTKVFSEVSAISDPVHDVPPLEAAEPFRIRRPAVFPSTSRIPDQYARVKAIFAKYDIEVDTSTWPAAAPRQSSLVEKQIRMRVRMTCHHCLTSYSGSRECTSCHHQRCERCTALASEHKSKGRGREHERGAEERMQNSTPVPTPATVHDWEAAADTGTLSADEAEDEAEVTRSPLNIIPREPKRRKEVPRVVPSRTGGPNLARKEPLQRIHRTCCKCRHSFVRESKVCPQCPHVRCIRCPRLPPKLEKWPNGCPGDVISAELEARPREWKKARLRVRWTCHECRKLFMEGESRCVDCSHTRCTKCERKPPKRARALLRQDTVNSVQEKPEVAGSPMKQPDAAGGPVIAASTLEGQEEHYEAAEPHP